MSKLIRFFTKILDICRLVPMLPVVVIAAIPLALLGDWRPWGNAMAIPVLGNPGFGQWLVIALVLIIVIDTVRGMIDDLRHGQVGVDVLAVVAILSTVAVAEYWASWAVTLMITSGEAIEEYAQAKAERSLTALMEAAPQTAHVVNLPGVGRGSAADKGDSSDGFRRVGSASAAAAAQRFDTVPVEQVQLGDVLMVLPGETVPVDGELLSGTATLDLSNINGEPVPREVFAGARVMSGAVNGSTALTMRATQVAADSQYQRILELVASAQESRPAVVKTADRLAVPFTVLSLVIAGVAWAVSGVPTRFAQVLVLATPCPLLIAAPVAYIAGTGRLAAAGVLIKAQDVLENLGRVTQVFFDKTGTLTVKQPQVVRVEMLPGAAALGVDLIDRHMQRIGHGLLGEGHGAAQRVHETDGDALCAGIHTALRGSAGAIGFHGLSVGHGAAPATAAGQGDHRGEHHSGRDRSHHSQLRHTLVPLSHDAQAVTCPFIPTPFARRVALVFPKRLTYDVFVNETPKTLCSQGNTREHTGMDFARMPTGAVPRFETGGIGIARNGPYGMNARRRRQKTSRPPHRYAIGATAGSMSRYAAGRIP